MAILAVLQLRRVLLVWAENWYGSSLGQDRALTKFSAQSDSTRRSWSLRKIAKIDFFKKWARSDILRLLPKSDDFLTKNEKFLLLLLSQLILTLCVHFQQFVSNFNFFDPKSALLTTFFPEQIWAKMTIWWSGEVILKGLNKFLKRHVLGQNELNKRFRTTRAP